MRRSSTKNKERLAIDSPVLSSVDAWRDWYQRPNGKRLDADFSVEEAGPLADGRFASNAIAAAISKARADDLHRLVVAELAENKTVLVVYGASPLMIHRPALDAALGPPCFIGADARLGPCR